VTDSAAPGAPEPAASTLALRGSGDAEERLARRAAKWCSENPAQAVSLLAAATYAALWVPTFIFYGRLGLTPDEVGLGVSSLIQASLSVILAALAGGALFGGILSVAVSEIVLQSSVSQALPAELGGSWRIKVWKALWTIGVLGTAATLALNVLTVVPTTAVLAAGAFDVVFLGWLPRRLICPWHPGIWNAQAEALSDAGGFARFRAIAFGVVYWGIPVFFVVLTAAAFTSGDQVRSGHTLENWLLPWRAVPVRVSAVPGQAPPALPDCHQLRYLGTANSLLVLYDARTHVVYRLPSASVAVATGSHAC